MMRKQRTRSLVAGLLLLATFTAPALAVEVAQPAPAQPAAAQGPVLYADQFQVVYKTVNGVEYYRIWNMTKAEWVTDWLVY